MSALAQSVRIKVSGFLKGLLGRPEESPVGACETPERRPNRLFGQARGPLLQERQLPNATAPGPVKGIELPLQKVLGGLPLELQPRIAQTDVGALTVSIPLDKVLAQLSTGTVRISFGELRQAAPGVFVPDNDRDRVMVTLPLEEVLKQLSPALIARRRAQRRVEVPSDICSPFDTQGQGLIFSVGPAKPEAAQAAPPRSVRPGPAAPQVRVRSTVPAPLTPPQTPTPMKLPGRQTFLAANRLAPPAPLPMTHAPLPPAPAPAMDTALRGSTEVNSQPEPAVSAPAPVPAAPAPEVPPLFVGLTALAESWPEAVRKDVVDFNLVDAKVALPGTVVEQALRQGRLAFSWKTLRSWIKPAVLPSVSAHDSTVLELPLKVVAPLFLTRQRETQHSRQKVSVDAEIPNLFFGSAQPEAAAPAPIPRPAPALPVPAAPANLPVMPAMGKPADTNYFSWAPAPGAVPVGQAEVRPHPSAGTRFVAKYATPNEIVARAAALDGVAGALIALPDGLMVASQLSPDLNGDTLAAFLPQIFGKVSQCTKELRMGELNNLNFTVGDVIWKIFRVNAIFFAAFGRACEPLPTAQLAALAAELDHKQK